MASATQAAAVLPEPVQCAAVYPQGWILACAAHNSSEVQIWHSSTQGQDWCFVTALQGHSGAVSGLDFNADGLLASCSYDRTTCIWRPSSNPRDGCPRQWTRELAETSVRCAGTCVKWSSLNQNKLAVGTASKLTAVICHEEQMGWTTHMTAKMSTQDCGVTCMAWHPSAHLLALGGTDGKVRLFNALCSAVDDPTDTVPYSAARPGQQLLCIGTSDSPCGWVNTLTWTDWGVTFATHSGQLHSAHLAQWVAEGRTQALAQDMYTPGHVQAPTQSLTAPGCPLKCLLAVKDHTLFAGGWDGLLLVFKRDPCMAQGAEWCLEATWGRFEHKGAASTSPPTPAHTGCITAIANLSPASSKHGTRGQKALPTSGVTPSQAGTRDSSGLGEDDVLLSPRNQPDQQHQQQQYGGDASRGSSQGGSQASGGGSKTWVPVAPDAAWKSCVSRPDAVTVCTVGLDKQLITWSAVGLV